VNDDKLNAIVQLARSSTENRGKADEAVLETFYAGGFNEAAVIELIGLVSIRIVTNYVYALTEIPIDFPLAETIS
jgi:alkylhydroperoxidase family enzyme